VYSFIALLLLPLLVAPSTTSDATAEARLAEIKAHFAARPMASSIADLTRIISDTPNSPASGTASVWLGDLAHQAKLEQRATTFYEAAYRFTGQTHCLADRGLGDTALTRGDYKEAYRYYIEGVNGAGPVLRAELEQKQALALRFLRRARFERVAWFVIACALCFLLWQSYPWRQVSSSSPLPWEFGYLLPIYALIVWVAYGRDDNVYHALLAGALGSLTLVVLSGRAASGVAGSPILSVLHGVATISANLALFYIVLNRTHLIDTLLFTFTLQAAQG
jgi:hypothetical protein